MGMAGSLFSYEAVDMPNANIVARVASTEEGKAEIERLLDSSRDDTRTMIEQHRHVVEELRDALLVRSELIGEEILEVIKGAAAHDTRNEPRPAFDPSHSTYPQPPQH
jgi:hypothetical protein